MKYMTRNDWQNYILGHSTRSVDPKKTANVIRGWIEIYLKESTMTIEILEKMLTKETLAPLGSAEAGSEEREKNKVALLLGRWNQIKRLCEDALGVIG
jgi:hypothetical protein